MNNWSKISQNVKKWTNFRIVLYWSFMGLSLLLLAISFYFWVGDVESAGVRVSHGSDVCGLVR